MLNVRNCSFLFCRPVICVFALRGSLENPVGPSKG